MPFDVTSDESVHKGLTAVRDRYGSRIAAVIHLAAYFDFSGEPNVKYKKVTVERDVCCADYTL